MTSPFFRCDVDHVQTPAPWGCPAPPAAWSVQVPFDVGGVHDVQDWRRAAR
jgi:hypothetical protein